jgi:pilus assembly protein CpaE
MQAFIVTDDFTTPEKARSALLRAGFDCPAGNVVSLDRAAAHPPAGADLVVVALSPDPERGLAAVARLRATVTSPVIAVGPGSDPRLVLRAVRAGAADFIDEQDVGTELTAALGRIRGALVRLPEPARTIAVLSPSGGRGASTVAANIATTLAAKGGSALLVDLKLRNGDLAALLDLKPAHDLAELCQNVEHMDRTLFERSLTPHESGVKLLAPPRWIPDAAFVTPDGVGLVIGLAKSVFPYVVMDVDNTFAPEQVLALREADVIVLVMRLDFASLRNAKRAIEYAAHVGIDRDKIRVVVNRYGQAKELPAARVEEALGVKIAHFVPEDQKTVNRANNNGIPVVRESPSARVSKSLMTLAASVNGRKHS